MSTKVSSLNFFIFLQLKGDMANGRPHGYGTWIDTSYQGELLTGYWRNGIPIGPFESTENDTVLYCLIAVLGLSLL